MQSPSFFGTVASTNFGKKFMTINIDRKFCSFNLRQWRPASSPLPDGTGGAAECGRKAGLSGPGSVEFDELVGVADGGEVAHEFVVFDQHRRAVVVGVEGVAGPVAHPDVEKDVDVVRRVVDQPECRHRSGAQPQPAFHPLGRRERQFALMQPLFEVADRQPLFGVEAHEIVAVALVVAEKRFLQCLAPSPRQYCRAISQVGASGCSYHS